MSNMPNLWTRQRVDITANLTPLQRQVLAGIDEMARSPEMDKIPILKGSLQAFRPKLIAKLATVSDEQIVNYIEQIQAKLQEMLDCGTSRRLR